MYLATGWFGDGVLIAANDVLNPFNLLLLYIVFGMSSLAFLFIVGAWVIERIMRLRKPKTLEMNIRQLLGNMLTSARVSFLVTFVFALLKIERIDWLQVAMVFAAVSVLGGAILTLMSRKRSKGK